MGIAQPWGGIAQSDALKIVSLAEQTTVTWIALQMRQSSAPLRTALDGEGGMLAEGTLCLKTYARALHGCVMITKGH